jgi:histidyl-tRNA synthetase
MPAPDLDIEHLLMTARLWKLLGMADTSAWKSTPWAAPRPAPAIGKADRLFRGASGQLDADAQRRLHTNPLRILDTKNPAMQALVEAAPS